MQTKFDLDERVAVKNSTSVYTINKIIVASEVPSYDISDSEGNEFNVSETSLLVYVAPKFKAGDHVGFDPGIIVGNAGVDHSTIGSRETREKIREALLRGGPVGPVKIMEKYMNTDGPDRVKWSYDAGGFRVPQENLHGMSADPKFKVGDMVTIPSGVVGQITCVGTEAYRVKTTAGYTCHYLENEIALAPPLVLEVNRNLWTREVTAAFTDRVPFRGEKFIIRMEP